MAEQLLDRAQVGAALQQMGRERVAQRVGADAHARAALRDVAPQQAIDAAAGQPRAAVVDEQRVRVFAGFARFGETREALAVGRGGSRVATMAARSFIHAFNAATGALVERQDSFLAALPHHADHPIAEVEILEVDRDELAQAQP